MPGNDEGYADILNRSWDEIPETQVLPGGSYLLKALRATYIGAKAADQNDCILFIYSPHQALDDVDTDELAALNQEGKEEYDISGNRIFARFWLETGADWDKVRKHMSKHGVDTAGRSIKQTLEAMKGTEVYAYLGSRTFTDNMGEVRQENTPENFATVE